MESANTKKDISYSQNVVNQCFFLSFIVFWQISLFSLKLGFEK